MTACVRSLKLGHQENCSKHVLPCLVKKQLQPREQHALRPILWDGAALNDIAVDAAEGNTHTDKWHESAEPIDDGKRR